jgi:hypothetical protein
LLSLLEIVSLLHLSFEINPFITKKKSFQKISTKNPEMKVLLVVLMVLGVTLAGRGGGGRKKTWYGPVASEDECAASTRLLYHKTFFLCC